MLIRSRAPLRLGLAGGGTDVSPFCDQFGGAVLNATIDLYAYCTIESSADGKVHFVAADRQQVENFEALPELHTKSELALHVGVYNRVVSEFNRGEPLAITVTTFCDAPAGSGLGSSSTLVVAMVQAYAELLRLPLGEYEVAKLAYKIERVDVGLQGGKQDQYAAAFGGFNFMEFNGNDRVLVNPLRVKDWIVSELESSLILFYTGRSRDSAAIIAEESKNVTDGNEQALSAMHHTKEEAIRMKDCLLRGDIRQVGAVMETAWAAKKKLAASVSNASIDRYYTVARDAGAYCGKVSGAGGGGFMMFLADPKNKLNVIKALTGESDCVTLGCHFSARGVESWRIE